jgi:cob(I)alamin adenosyltransferase
MSIFTQERARDLENVLSDLQSELRRTQNKLTDASNQLIEERNRRIRAEGELYILRKKVDEYEQLP